MADAQGGRLAAPAWTQFMTEVYRRRPSPPDWPRPQSIITREIDFTTGLLQTPYCPRDAVGTEFYIAGTEPTHECDKHLGYQTGYDSLGMAPQPAYPPPPAYNPSPSVSQPRVTPGASPTPRRAAPDTTHNKIRLDTGRTTDSLSAPRAR